MKKILKLQDKDIDIFISIAFMVTILAFFKELSADDELWNFAYIYKMNLGLIPYKDINIIITPLFHIVGVIILKIFGFHYLGFRIYNSIIFTIFYFLIFKIFKNLKMEKVKATLYTLLIFIISMCLITSGANYNIMVFIPILVSLLLLIKNNKNYNIHAILIFITFLIKQNVGIYFAIGIIINIIVNYKNNIKKSIKEILKIIVINILLFLGFAYVLYNKGILVYFISNAFGGIQEFASNNIKLSTNIITMLLEIAILLFTLIITHNKKITVEKEIRENINTIYSIAIPLMFISYPIFNYYHIITSIILITIGFIYLLEKTLISEIINKNITKKIVTLIMIMILIKTILLVTKVVTNNYIINNNSSPYYGTWIKQEDEIAIQKISEFIKTNNLNGIDVKVLSIEANAYMLPLSKNNNLFDLPLLGNLGKEGEEGLIRQIKELKNTKILILTNEEDMFWQESKKARKYIQENYKKEGTIENFDIYYIE